MIPNRNFLNQNIHVDTDLQCGCLHNELTIERIELKEFSYFLIPHHISISEIILFYGA
jgi:hypothetical protein